MSHSYLYQSYQTVPWYLSQSFSQTPLSSSLPQLSSSSSPRKCPSDFMISNKVICICQPWILSSQSSYHHWSRYHWISSQCCSPRDHQWWISRKERPCCLKWLQLMFTEYWDNLTTNLRQSQAVAFIRVDGLENLPQFLRVRDEKFIN